MSPLRKVTARPMQISKRSPQKGHLGPCGSNSFFCVMCGFYDLFFTQWLFPVPFLQVGSVAYDLFTRKRKV